jgi:hypothetical protein
LTASDAKILQRDLCGETGIHTERTHRTGEGVRHWLVSVDMAHVGI